MADNDSPSYINIEQHIGRVTNQSSERIFKQIVDKSHDFLEEVKGCL